MDALLIALSVILCYVASVFGVAWLCRKNRTRAEAEGREPEPWDLLREEERQYLRRFFK